MKEIKAVIRPNRLPQLRDKLRELPGFPGMTVSKAEGCSAPNRHVRTNFRQDLTDFTPKTRIEIVAPDEVAESIVELIIKVCQSGQVGDGLVWVTEVTQASFIFKTMPGQDKA